MLRAGSLMDVRPCTLHKQNASQDAVLSACMDVSLKIVRLLASEQQKGPKLRVLSPGCSTPKWFTSSSQTHRIIDPDPVQPHPMHQGRLNSKSFVSK
eukprot:3013089-Amphidinium_carterae.1